MQTVGDKTVSVNTTSAPSATSLLTANASGSQQREVADVVFTDTRGQERPALVRL